LLLDLASPHAVSFSGGFSNAGRLSLWQALRVRWPASENLHIIGRVVRQNKQNLLLADVRCPDNNLFADRATARIIALLAAYDRDPRLAARWEERFANGRKNNFPFGISLTYQNLLRTYFTQ